MGKLTTGWLAVALFSSTTAYAHPDHDAADPAEPTGNADDASPPNVRGIDPDAKPKAQPVETLTDDQLLALANAAAEAEAKAAGETITIVDEAPAESASSIHLDRSKLGTRSRTQMSDILRQVPGLIVSQHAGGGKADQYFIRGFDADHGTDIAVFADGVPVNLTSHGHGQGYADTHWLIPELIDSVDVHKGPYAARFGDFYTAGALELKTIDSLSAKGTVYLSGGSALAGTRSFNLDRRMVAIASPEFRANDKSILAAEIGEQDGAFVHPQDFQRGIAMGKWQGDVGRGRLKLETNWYTARWNQSGQLPVNLVESGALDRFGAIDPSEGGDAQRASVRAAYDLPAGEGGTVRAAAYGVRNQLDLFSNFTLWANDPIHGDQIEQTDARWLYGAEAAYQKSIHREGFDALVTSGVQLRADDVETSLWHAEKRQRLDVRNHNDSAIRDLGAYAEANIIPTSWLHVFPGVRVDRFMWNVTDLAMPGVDQMPETPETAARTIASPKLSVELHPTNQINFFANSGAGFHSNDARAAVASKGEGALARAVGGEVGTRVKPSEHSRVSMDVWYLHLSSEQVWSGDNGGTEASSATNRFGLDIEGSTALTSWLAIDGNVTWAKARFAANASNGGAVALAPRWMGSAGATATHGKSFISLRGRGISDRPGNEDGSLVAEGYLVMDLVAGTQRGSWGLNVTVNNLTNTKWREAQFAEESRVSPTADVMEQMHFTPGIPLTATAQVSYAY
ncbi:MAG TPA: TonB-dependent receptor [Kofleriaceae bacterium]|nr:TonB-dependent receptor [Kofleriaceae bacterium]